MISVLSRGLTTSGRSIGRGLPDSNPTLVVEFYIVSAIREWRSPTISLVENTHTTIKEHMRRIVEEHFGNFRQSDLCDSVQCVQTGLFTNGV